MGYSSADKTVLIVDDEAFFRKILRDMVEQEGFTVIAEAADGIDAVEAFRRHRPSVILMDIYMPKKSGIEATENILAIDGKAKVVICSGQNYDDDAETCLAGGARYVIQKPFIKEEVVEIINRVIGEE